MKRLPALLLCACLCAPTLPPLARADFIVPGFELVLTAPVETSLSQEELRAPAQVWPEMFAAARKSIDIAQFYVTPKAGEPLEPALAALRKAGERGVRIRFLAEKKMAEASAEGFERLRAIPNLELRVIDYSALEGGGILHAKYFVVDGKAAYLGSQNFDWRSLKHIHELGLRVSDPETVAGMLSVFETDWRLFERLAAGKARPLNKSRPPAASGRRAYLVASPWRLNPPGVGDSETELVRLIGTAEREVRVQLLDYAPLDRRHVFYAPIDNALREAASRGVRVKLMVSHWNTDTPAVEHLKSLSLVPGVEIKIITLPQSSQGRIPFSRVIHAKYMVVDSKALWLGTSNWSGGYLDRSRNLELVVKDASLAERVLALHSGLWDSAYAAPVEVSRVYPRPER